MLSSTVALAAAANYPAPFVTSGVADVAVVYGTAQVGGTDLIAATDITTSLNSKVVAASGTPVTITGGDSVKLERGSDKFNYGNNMSTHYASFDDGELSTVLKDSVFLNDDNTEYKYEQKIEMGKEGILFFHDSQFNDDTPVVGFNMDRNDHILNYTLDFTPTNADGGTAVSSDEFPKLDNQDIEILGKKYYISDAEVTTNGVQLTLLDSSSSASIAEGETKTMTIGSTSYEVAIDFISTTEVKLSINGELTNSMTEGQTYKLSDGTYVGVKDISARDVAGVVSKVEFSLGIGKVVLEQGQEVKLNDDDVSELADANGYTSVLKAYFTNTTTTIDKVVIDWNLDDDAWLKPGMEMSMPGFGAIKMSYGAWNGATDSSEKTELGDGGHYVKLTAPIQQGELKMGILYSNTTHTGFSYPSSGGIGEDSTHKLVTNITEDPVFFLNETENSYFVVTWLSGDEAETYAYEIGSITSASGKNTTKLNNLVSGQPGLEFGTLADTQDVGQITFTLVDAQDTTGIAQIKATGGSVYGDIVATKTGMTLRLPHFNVSDTDGADGVFNTSASLTTWTMNVTEEDKDGNIHTANTAAPRSFTVTLDGTDVDGTQATGTSLTEVDEVDNSDWEIAYMNSDIATKVRFYNPSGNSLKRLEVYYPGKESYADVFVTESAALVSASGSTILPVLDSEVVTAKNLVVVGGSCVNTVAATLLGGALCGADFEQATGVGADSFLIKTYNNPDGKGGVATLVAGYNAGDTTMGATYLKTQTVDTTVGKAYKGTSATAATLIV